MSCCTLSIAGLRVSIGGRAILRDIDLELRGPGQLFLMGNNGAGKSTLLRCVLRQAQFEGGRIELAGRSIHEYSQRELARLVSYVPQQAGLPLGWKVGDLLELSRHAWLDPLEPLGTDDRLAINEAIDMCGCADLEQRALGSLSGGERQRVLIAAALAQSGRIMLLDEPTAFLDPKHQAEIQALLARLGRARELAIITVTHDLNSCVRADRIVALEAGRLAFDGPPGEFLQEQRLASIYGTAFRVSQGADGLPIVLGARR